MKNNFWKNKKVLITGQEGFLGSWLSKILLELDAKIVGIDIVKRKANSFLGDLRAKLKNVQADVANLKVVTSTIDDFKPSIIFHLAAQAIVGEAVNIPIRTFKTNIEGTWNVLEASRGKRFIEGIVLASSDKAYGSYRNLPYKEETPLKGVYPYDVSKSCADLLAYTYFKTYKVPVCVTRCGNIFGPGDLHFSRIVPEAMRSVIKNKKFIIRSDGKFTRDYIYIEDVVRGYLMLAQKMRESKLFGETFNFSNEEPISVLELVKIIYKACDRKPSYKILNKVKYEIRNQFLSAQKAKRMLGWKPKYILDEGLKRTFKWYKDYFSCK